MNIKILWIFVFLLCISSVSAWDWDNVKDYDEETKTITVTNALGLGREIANITLLSEQMVKVYTGKNEKKIAEILIRNYNESYPSAFTDMDFYDMNNELKEIDKDFVYKYKVPNGIYLADTWDKNGNVNGQFEVPLFKWVELENEKMENFPKGEITIGVFTNVKKGEKTEWVPTLFGVEITEWAGVIGVAEEVWYKFEDNTDDSSGNGITRTDATGVTFNTTNPKHNDYSIYYGLDQNSSFTDYGITSDDHDRSIGFWVYKVSPWILEDSGTFWYAGESPTGWSGSVSQLDGNDATRLKTSSGANSIHVNITNTSHGNLVPATWYHIVWTYEADGDNSTLYLNGEPAGSGIHSGASDFDNTSGAFKLNSYFVGNAHNSYTMYDGFRLYDVLLDSSDVAELYAYTTNTASIVSNQFPLNTTSQTFDSANFTFNVTDSGDTVVNCSLFINGVWVADDTSITQIVNQTFNRTGLTVGQKLWKIGCYDDEHLQGNSSEYNLTITLDTPVVTNIFPENSTFSYSPSANFTYNVTTTSHSITSCDLFINNVLNATDNTIDEDINQTFNLTTLDYGDSIWLIQCESSEGYKANSTSWNYSREIVYPIIRNQFPLNNTNYSTTYINFTYNTTIDYGTVDECSLFLNDVLSATDDTITEIVNQTFNTTLSDNYYDWLIECKSNLGIKYNSTTYNLTIDLTAPVVTESVGLIDIIDTTFPITSYWYFNVSDEKVGVETCWYYTSDNSSNTSITCNANTTIAWAIEGLKSVSYCANDTLGNEECRTNGFEVFYYNWTQSASKDILGEGGSATFDLVINMTDLKDRFENTYAYLNYNNTQYSPSLIHNAENYTFSYTLAIPLGTGSSTGNTINWNWSYAILNSTDTLVNTTTTDQTQTIYSMGVGNCSFYNYTILNYTLKSEENKTILNGTIETDFIIRSSLDDIIRFNYSILNEGVKSIEVCVSNETLIHEDYRLYVTTRYEADGHVIEYHYIENYNLSSASPIQYIDLYDLGSADSTSFLINYKDEFYLSVEGAIIDIQRFYVGDGIYRSVEMGKTNDAGQTRAHLVTEDVKYMFYVRVDGTLVYVSPEYLALCLTAPCHIDLYEITDTSSEYEEAGNIDYTFDLDKTARSITFIFSTQDGTSSDIDMNVTKMDAYSNHTACEETQTSSGGSLTCTVPTAYSNTTYIVEIYEDKEFITQRFFNLNPPAEDFFGYTGVFLSFIVIITLVFMAITSGIAMIVFAILGLIIVGTINIINVGNILGVGSAVVWLSVAGVIIIYKLSQRRYH